jgi:hypothetical protein
MSEDEGKSKKFRGKMDFLGEPMAEGAEGEAHEKPGIGRD